MERADTAGFALAIVAHAALFGALSLSLLVPKPLPKIENDPIEVSLVDEVAMESAAPDRTPAPAPAPVAGDVQPSFAEPDPAPLPEPTPPAPQPVAKPVPTPQKPAQPKPVPPKPAPPKASPAKPASAKPAPAKPPASKPAQAKTPAAKPGVQTRRPGLALDPSIVGNARNERGQSAKPTPAADGGMRAQKTAAQWEASFIQSVLRKIQPYWKAPTGPDAQLLKSNLMIRLNRDGTVASVTVASQTGETDSNRNLKALHAERATKAVQRAGRFEGLPDELYDIWQTLGPITFDKKL